MPVANWMHAAAVAALLLIARGDDIQAQAFVPALRIEPSMRLRRASERPLEHEGASVSNGDTLIELAARWRLRYASMFVALEGSTVPEWFDAQQVRDSYLRGTPLSPQQLFAPAGARKLSLGLERVF